MRRVTSFLGQRVVRILSVVSLAAALLFALTMLAGADNTWDTESTPPFVGVYFASGTVVGLPSGEGIPTNLTLTLHQDGTFAATYSLGGTVIPGVATLGEEGLWESSGPNEIVATSLSFDYLPPSKDPPHGSPQANSLTTWTMTIDGDTITGMNNGAGYAPDDNPLHPTGPPLYTYTVTFAGEALPSP